MKKKWIISAGVALALGALATVAIAERGGKMREHRQPAMRMLGRLDLTDEQKGQLKESLMEVMRQHREAINKILTEEQRETMEAMRTKAKIWSGGKIFGRRGDKDRHDMRRGGKGTFSGLDLTDEQKDQLVELRKEQRTEMRESRQKHRTALESVLTDGQREKLEEMKDEAFYSGGRRWRGKR